MRKTELSEALSGLNPAWFSLVMATGIVGLAAHTQGISVVPTVLMWVNVVFYALSWAVYMARLVLFPRDFFGDFRKHMRAMGYFTVVAGSGVLGTQLLLVGGYRGAALALWVLALVLWCVLVYAIPAALIAQREGKPTLQRGIQGNWLLWTVGTASVSVLGTRVAPSFGSGASQVVFWSFLLWLISVIFYLWVIAMIIQRLFFYDLEAGDLLPTYWIDMGAFAIATLAGAVLLSSHVSSPLLRQLEPFTMGLTLVLWAIASWWIPWLFLMGIWRHFILRYPLWFNVGWWGMVFPLGMYTTATATLAQAMPLPAILKYIAAVFVWIAIAAWVVTFVNMLITLWRRPLSSGLS
ncbi:tellurite resistance/C4-dicarboxylate transporter family protein [Rubrobacter calidifluminis]|uniref:tellurite resistance/C4-dicarboxylate transporter family protein n=1 Tax=Rubrobacter calidifluminis TaxID=1392640 RepID=UPI00236147EA|nr:tellurite resistance/C4-dicarboxylate transporter family protein [Rubrobacter calidifluminis]